MKQLNFAEVLDASYPSQNCVSIYLPPLTKLSNFREGEAKLNSVLREVQALSAKSESDHHSHLMDQIQRDAKHIKDLQKKHGVAWFASEMTSGYLPSSWRKDPFAVVSQTFHVKPLFRDYQKMRPFYVLTFSAQNVKLFRRWQNSIYLIDAISLQPQKEGIANFRESHRKHKHRSRQSQVQVAEQLMERHLRHSEDPVILAGSNTSIAAFRSIARYPFLLEDSIACNSDKVSIRTLNQKAMGIFSKWLDQKENHILEEFRFCQKSKKALTNVHEVAKAAANGRVEQLIIAEDHHLWGVLNWDTGSIRIHPHQKDSEDDDVLDDLSELVYQHKGSVWVMRQEKLGKEKLYATLRW